MLCESGSRSHALREWEQKPHSQEWEQEPYSPKSKNHAPQEWGPAAALPRIGTGAVLPKEYKLCSSRVKSMSHTP